MSVRSLTVDVSPLGSGGKRELSTGKGRQPLSSGLLLLSEARELIAHGWTQGADARDASGAAVDAWAPSAGRWSLLGALVAVLERQAATTGEMRRDELAAAL